ncbi:OsmC family protein [Kitasatospora sp. NBC_00240]|uniref:OsmC family protein n=1 Tax=Kitasatospora sp. NBC_00240 TaxID=2903567 RepID=UPI0022525715|nr:OsmC family protein [Kitasatospora sp. NBC_00240]MCX5213826.1 OsmC family protein [Kitasatospora sp. NBC_00240]
MPQSQIPTESPTEGPSEGQEQTPPEFRKVTTAVVTGSASGVPYHVDVRSGTHHLTADEPVRRGGSDSGPEPFALLLSALGSCTAITLRMYAGRKGWPLADVKVRLGYETDGRSGRISRRVTLGGELDQEQRARLLDICERTPVTLALREGVAIDTTEEH